jgi:ligand-binding sensor domain-containing protein/signal transduction histidine kinase
VTISAKLAGKTIALSLACLSICSFCQLTNLNLEHFNTANGLSQNLVYSMAQDKQGFIWFGTDEGLNRFDGFEFKKFRHVPGDTNSLVDNSVHALLADTKGILWIGTNRGISQYNPTTEAFKNLPIDYYDITKLNGNSVNALREDSGGKIWITYLGSGVDVIIPGEKVILHYTVHREENDPYRIKDDYVTAIEFLKNGEVILGTRTGLIFLNKDRTVMSDKVVENKFPWATKIDASVKIIKSADRGNELWFGTETSGVVRVDLLTNEIQIFNTHNSTMLFNNNVPALLEDSRNNVWIGGEAIYLFNRSKGTLIPYNEFGIPDYVETKNPILSAFEDRDHNIWFGTFRIGALKFNPKSARLLHYHSKNGDHSIGNDQILSFAEDDNRNIWVGTDGGGLYQLSNDLYTFTIAPQNNRFSSQVIKCIYRDKAGDFWMGTWDGGMMQYNPQKGALQVYNPEKGNFPSHHVWDIQPDGAGNLWIASLRDGLYHFSPQTKKFTNYKNDPTDSSSLVNNDVLAIFPDSQNTLWVGTSNGLSVLYPGAEKFVNRHGQGNLNNALCFFEDAKKRIWIGTNGGGIIIVNHDLTVVKVLAEKDGLTSTTICSIIPDEKNRVWVSTYNGLMTIDINNFVVTPIPPALGTLGKEFIARSGLKTSNGKMLFGGVDGFNMFHPDSLLLAQVIPDVVFTSLQIQSAEILPGIKYNDRIILEKSIAQTKNLILNYSDNSFTLSFSPLVYNWQNNIQFTYKLENFDPDWQFSTSDKRFVHYTSLDPGTYKLHIKASFDGKTWPSASQVMTITVTPPWWGTFFFRFLVGVTIMGVLYGAYKARVRLLKMRQLKLERVVTERTRELRESNREIRKLLDAVAEQKKQIEEKNSKLVQANDAVVNQRDDLEIKSSELMKAQQRLMEINTNLETLVEKRTQKLSNTLRELETFLYRASHDLRGPISSMLGILNVSELEKDTEQVRKTYSELFRKSVLQLDRALQKLLLKHTLERKKLVNEIFTKPDLEIFVWEVSGEIPSIRASDLKIDIEESFKLSIDRLILKTLLVNLLENAFFYSIQSTNKAVVLKATTWDDKHVISVTDHGPGIDQNLREKIFEMFFRGHEFSTGNGLGLYMVRSALEKVNGQIELDSEVGSYSTFRVLLP